MGVTIWLISDTHFGHENIIKYCSRPFASADEMDEALIANWNSVVKPQDHIYHLGDVAVSQNRLHKVMPRLAGHKRLILGNHDNHAPIKDYAQYFDKILVWRLFKPFILTHIPIHRESFGKATINIHGHTHEKPPYSADYINVSVERINYTPIALEELHHGPLPSLS
jgi:calcineurin-like phosphoesterase family protein